MIDFHYYETMSILTLFTKFLNGHGDCKVTVLPYLCEVKSTINEFTEQDQNTEQSIWKLLHKMQGIDNDIGYRRSWFYWW